MALTINATNGPIVLWDGFDYKPHQTTAVEWMLSRERSDPSGGLLCDEMGLGKTMEVLGVIKNSPKNSTLLLCPKAVVPQWRTAALRSGLNVCEVKGHVWSIPKPFRSGAPFLFIANYEKLASKRTGLFFSRTWHRVVLDEAHRAKNRSGLIFSSVERMTRETTWCVTATPVVNDLADIRALFQLVGYDKTRLTNTSFLYETVNQACLHRSMEEMRPVLAELPAAPKVKKERLDFETEDEEDFYRGIQGALARRWKALEHDNIKAFFVLLMRLRQLSLHPQVYINARKREWAGYNRKDWDGSSTKFSVLRTKIETCAEPRRWIVFCQFHDEMDMLQEFLGESMSVGSVLQYHGGLTEKAKADALAATHDDLNGKHQVLLLQLHSGGVGLNLQHFTRIIFMSPWWTAAMMDQAIGRAVRIGQDDVVEVTLLVLKEEETMNIDEKMLSKADTKRSVLARVFEYASRGLMAGDEVIRTPAPAPLMLAEENLQTALPDESEDPSAPTAP
jgi:SNF2 family DNA or RNA helicase